MFTEINTVTETKSTLYKCSVCDFQTLLKDGAVRHYALNHACKKTEGYKYYEHNAYQFDTEEDAKIWLHEAGTGSQTVVVWTGPGWYFLRVVNGDYSLYSLLPVDKYCQVLEEDSAKLLLIARSIKDKYGK